VPPTPTEDAWNLAGIRHNLVDPAANLEYAAESISDEILALEAA